METEGESRLSELDGDQTRQRITAKATETETEKKNTSVVLPRAHVGTLARIDRGAEEEGITQRASRVRNKRNKLHRAFSRGFNRSLYTWRRVNPCR